MTKPKYKLANNHQDTLHAIAAHITKNTKWIHIIRAGEEPHYIPTRYSIRIVRKKPPKSRNDNHDCTISLNGTTLRIEVPLLCGTGTTFDISDPQSLTHITHHLRDVEASINHQEISHLLKDCSVLSTEETKELRKRLRRLLGL